MLWNALYQTRRLALDVVFLLPPTRVDQVEKVATNGLRMPHKSTDFYPKLLSGMVMNKMICKKDEW